MGIAYNVPFTTSGGIGGTYNFSVQSGALPNGIDIAGQALTGRPTQSGTFNFVIRVQDTNTAFPQSPPPVSR